MSLFGIDIGPSRVCVIPGNSSKKDALNRLVDTLSSDPAITDGDAFRKAVFEREGVTSTGIGGGVGIPHVRISSITEPLVGVGIIPEGLDYDSMDHQPVNILVLFAMPAESNREYLRLLAQVMNVLRNRDIFDRLTACDSPEAVSVLLNDRPPV